MSIQIHALIFNSKIKIGKKETLINENSGERNQLLRNVQMHRWQDVYRRMG